jgi:hypothetical protein
VNQNPVPKRDRTNQRRKGGTYGALLAGAHLLESTQRLSDSEALAWLDSVALALGNPNGGAGDALGRLGLKADPERELLMANSGAVIERVDRGSTWSQGGHRARLLELKGATPAGPQQLQLAGSVRCVMVPWDLLEPDPELLRAAKSAQAQRGGLAPEGVTSPASCDAGRNSNSQSGQGL